MFFLDSSGFFSLVCLMIQCGIAWIFAVLFGVLASRRPAWMHSFQVAFVGLAIGLTAVATRFLLLRAKVGGGLNEGDLAVRAFYGLYLAGKLLFLGGLLRGVSHWRGGLASVPTWLLALLMPVGFTIGFAVPTIEAVLLVQGPLVIATSLYCAGRLRPFKELDLDNRGRSTVRVVLYLMAVAWAVNVVATGVNIDGTAGAFVVLNYMLQFNSAIDLGLELMLAAGLIIAVLTEAYDKVVKAQEERDALRNQVQRDDKLRVSATLISGVAHEINNPLTAIIGYGEDLASDDAEIRQHAAKIVQEQASRCRAIVKRMSAIGRRQMLSSRSFRAAERIQRVVDGMRPQLEEAGVQIVVDVPEQLHLVADIAGFEQVLTNLVGNAIQVSDPGQSIEVAVVPGQDGARMTVRDHGPGVPVEDRSRIFEPFWTTKRPNRGTGLGLAVVDAIVHAHSGTLQVEDADGGGAVFSVLWPWRTPSASETPMPPVSEEALADLEEDCKYGRLLVIDDEKLVRATIRRHAETHGWEVEDVDSAEDALSRLMQDASSYDAIVCDMRMPGMSGAQFHDELVKQKSPMLEHTLFVTGDLASHDAMEFSQRCQADVLPKPFVPSELLKRLDKLRNQGPMAS